MAEISGISRIYGTANNEKSKQLINHLVEVGTVSVVAKSAIAALKAIPGVNVAASILNAVIAGSIVATLGEGAAYIFEQIYLGKKTIDDIDWVTKVMESKFSTEFLAKVQLVLKQVSNESDAKKIALVIFKEFAKKSKK